MLALGHNITLVLIFVLEFLPGIHIYIPWIWFFCSNFFVCLNLLNNVQFCSLLFFYNSFPLRFSVVFFFSSSFVILIYLFDLISNAYFVPRFLKFCVLVSSTSRRQFINLKNCFKKNSHNESAAAFWYSLSPRSVNQKCFPIFANQKQIKKTTHTTTTNLFCTTTTTTNACANQIDHCDAFLSHFILFTFDPLPPARKKKHSNRFTFSLTTRRVQTHFYCYFPKINFDWLPRAARTERIFCFTSSIFCGAAFLFSFFSLSPSLILTLSLSPCKAFHFHCHSINH